MTKVEFEQYLSRLDLSAAEAAKLLGVTPRTVRRWLDGEEIPGPAEQAIRAWIKLHDRYLPWQPDSRPIDDDNAKQIEAHRWHAIDVAGLITRVEARGGPRMPWKVDRSRGCAVLGPIQVTFYKLLNGGFSLCYYTRGDVAPDLLRDAELVDDAAYCIGQSLKKEPDFGPVTLVVQDGPAKGRVAHQRREQFPSNKEAIDRACKAIGSPGFHDPFITTRSPSEVIFDHHELQQECEMRNKAPTTLAALADNVRNNSAFFVRSGPQMLTPVATAQHLQRIEALADKLDGLAAKAREGLADYQQFDAVLGELHAAGFFPDGELVSAVTKVLVHV